MPKSDTMRPLETMEEVIRYEPYVPAYVQAAIKEAILREQDKPQEDTAYTIPWRWDYSSCSDPQGIGQYYSRETAIGEAIESGLDTFYTREVCRVYLRAWCVNGATRYRYSDTTLGLEVFIEEAVLRWVISRKIDAIDWVVECRFVGVRNNELTDLTKTEAM